MDGDREEISLQGSHLDFFKVLIMDIYEGLICQSRYQTQLVHVTIISRTCGGIRRHLTKSVAITLCNAFVGSRIDYCNSLYYGISDKQMQRLQGVQNTL